jgi:hypothetical protein
MYRHATITIDDRCLDLLLTEEEIEQAFDRSLYEENKVFINKDNCCKCWPVEKPPKCRFWSKILGMCYECDN